MQGTERPEASSALDGGGATPEFRYERKLVATGWSVERATQCVLHATGLIRETYPARRVRSLYFDTPDLGDFHASAEGHPNRKKVRLRGYDGGPPERLELKIRHGEVFEKQVHSWPATPETDTRALLALSSRRPRALVEYERRYFAGWGGRLRITIDWNMRFSSSGSLDPNRAWASQHLMRSTHIPRGVVVEFKYSLDGVDLARRAFQCFPFRLTRHSKYVLAVEATASAP